MNTLNWWLHAKYHKFNVFFTHSFWSSTPETPHYETQSCKKKSWHYSVTPKLSKTSHLTYSKHFRTHSLLIYLINNHCGIKILNPAHNCTLFFSPEGCVTVTTLRSVRLLGHTKHRIIAKTCLPAGDLSQSVKIETFPQVRAVRVCKFVSLVLAHQRGKKNPKTILSVL